MLPSSPEALFNTADSGSIIINRHQPHHFESSACARPQMAWQMYEQLLRIANKQKQHEQQSNQRDDDKEADTKRLWLAAFTGSSLSYRPGVAAGAAEPL